MLMNRKYGVSQEGQNYRRSTVDNMSFGTPQGIDNFERPLSNVSQSLGIITLDAQYHVSRQTGALSRNIERGTKAIQMVLAMLLFNLVPTIFEMVLVCGVLGNTCGASF
eukprot:gene21671-8359_t